LWNPRAVGMQLEMEAIQDAANTLRLRLHSVAVKETATPDDFDKALSQIRTSGAGSLIVLCCWGDASHRARITNFAAARRMPTIYPVSQYSDAGGLISYGPSWIDINRRAAYFVDRILKGSKPADLPVESPIKFELVVNLKAAKKIGLTIPESVLQRADRVIQ